MSVDFPFFSIVIPTYKRPRSLAACIDSITELDYPKDRFELLIVHDSLDSSLPEKYLLEVRTKIDIQELNQGHAGPAAARNLGGFAARGDYLAFTDDDCLVAPNWLCAMASHLAIASEVACAGHTINYHERNRYSEASQMINEFVTSQAEGMKLPFVTSNNLVIPTASFRAFGGFNTKFPAAAGEDRELTIRWLRSGNRLDHVPEAVIHHAQNLNLKGFLRQQLGYGKAAFLLRLLQREDSHTDGMERSSFYVNLVKYPLLRGISLRNIHLMFLLGVSQVAVATGFLLQRREAARQARQLSQVVAK